MPSKYVCSCGAPQFQSGSVILSRSESKEGLNHEFEETFNVWICEFCGEKKNVLAKATRKSKGKRQPREFIVNQYAPVLVNMPKNRDHIRVKTFIKILEEHYPERSPIEILDDMLLEGVVQVDYTMRNANRDLFIPMRVRINPTFEDEIRKILDEYRGIESIDEKVKRVEQILSTVGYRQTANPQSEKILSILKIQDNLLSKDEIPYFDCAPKKCQIKEDNDRYETLLKILLALLQSVSEESIVVSSDFYRLVNLNDANISEYKSDIESILSARLIFFGILKNVEPLYIPPSKIPKEVSTEIERFEIDLRSFIKTNLLDYYKTIQNVIDEALKTIFSGAWKRIDKKMIEDLESDYDITKDLHLKSGLNIAKKSQQYNQLLFDRVFEAMVMGDLIKIVEHEWDEIFSKPFNPMHKNDVLTKLKIIKGDRNIKSHPKSRIPTTFKTLTHIFEFSKLSTWQLIQTMCNCS